METKSPYTVLVSQTTQHRGIHYEEEFDGTGVHLGSQRLHAGAGGGTIGGVIHHIGNGQKYTRPEGAPLDEPWKDAIEEDFRKRQKKRRK